MMSMNKTLFFCIFIFFQGAYANDAEIDFDEYGYMLHLSLRDESYNPTENKNYTDSLFTPNATSDSRSHHDILPRTSQVYRMDKRPYLQKKIDSIYTDIFKTKTGQKICQQRTDGSIPSITNYFGISSDIAMKISAVCQPFDSNKKVSSHPQKYYLVATEDHFSLDSWTTHKNETYFYIDAIKYKNLNSDAFYNHLTKLIMHELNIKSDTTEVMLTQLLEGKKGIKSNFHDCEIQSAVNNPYIKNAFRAIRSFELENKIMSEMNPQVNISKIGYSCREKIKSILQPVLDIASNLQPDDVYFAYTVLNKCSQNLNQLPENFDKVINILLSTTIENNKLSTSLCDYLSKPNYTNESRLILTSGPRPRVGGGSSDDAGDSAEHSPAKINDLMFKLNNKTKQSILDKKTDHFKNYKINVENYSEWMD